MFIRTGFFHFLSGPGIAEEAKLLSAAKARSPQRGGGVGTNLILSRSSEWWGEGGSIIIFLEPDFLRATFDPLNYSPMLMKVHISSFLKNSHFYLAVLGWNPQALQLVDKCCTTELHPQPRSVCFKQGNQQHVWYHNSIPEMLILKSRGI